ncbi:MAG: hypothetical protein ACKVTZ_10275 [Bacteroidia bacterium]
MPYGKYTLTTLKEHFGLTSHHCALFAEVEPKIPSEWLLETLKRSLAVAYTSEKARSEAIVMPILLEIRTQNENKIAIYSGANLEADKEQDLNGECDFILSYNEQGTEVESPIFCMIEAKDGNIVKAFGQCAAQMLGAQLFNHKKGKDTETMYGCVNNGNEWKFLKLQGKTILIDTNSYFINDLPQILGVLQKVIDGENHSPNL